MRGFGKVGLGLGLGLLLLAAAVGAGFFLVRSTLDPDTLARRLEALSGGRMAVDGPFAVRIWPRPAVTVAHVGVTGLPGLGRVDATGATVSLQFWPLLRGRLVPDAIAVEAGRLSWRVLDGTGSQTLDGVGARLLLDGDEGGGILRLAGRWRGLDLDLNARLSAPAGAEARRSLAMSLDLPGADSRFEIDGSVVPGARAGSDRPLFTGTARGKGPSVARLAAALTGSGFSAAAPDAAFAIDMGLSATADMLTLSDLHLTAGPVLATGKVLAALADKPRVDIDLAVPSLDFDHWSRTSPSAPVPPSPPPAPAPAPASVSPASALVVALPPPPAAPASTGPTRFALPQSWFVNLTATVGTMAWRGQVMRDGRLEATLDDGELTLRRLSAQLPAATEVVAEGTLAAEDGKPVFDGSVSASSGDFRGLLDRFGLRGVVWQPGRLNRMTLSADLTGSPSLISIDSLALGLDSLKIAGRGTLRLDGPRPSLAMDMSLPDLDLDAYWPHLSPPTPPPPASGTDAPPALAGAAPEAEKSGPFSAWDFSLDVSAPGAIWHRARLESLALAVDWSQGDLDIRHVRADLGGATVEIAGWVRGAASDNPLFDGLGVKAIVSQPGRVARLFDAGDPAWFDALGSARLQATLAGPWIAVGRATAGSAPAATAAFDIAAGPSRLAGTATGGVRDGQAVVTADLAQGGLDFGDAAAPSPWRVEGIAGRVVFANRSVRAEGVRGTVLGGALALDLAWTGGDAPGLGGTVTLAGADIARLPGRSAAVTATGMRVSAGRVDGSARFETHGGSEAEMLARLNGDIRASVADGVIEGIDLAAIDRVLGHPDTVGNLLALARVGLGGGNTRFSSLSGQGQVRNGVLVVPDARLDIAGDNATGAATIDLARRMLDAHLDFRLADGTAPPLTLRLSGPWDSPRKTIDINALERYLLARGMGRALDKGGKF